MPRSLCNPTILKHNPRRWIKKAPTDKGGQSQWGRYGKIATRQKEVILPASSVPQMKLKMEEIRTPQQLAHLATGGAGHRTGMAPCPGGKLAQTECFLSIRKTTILRLTGWLKTESAECRLHPLIHTFGFWGLGTKCWGKTL